MEYVIAVALVVLVVYLVWRKKKAKEKAKADALASPAVPDPISNEQAFKDYVDRG